MSILKTIAPALFLALLIAPLACALAEAAEQSPKDAAALSQLETGKAVFDIRTKDIGRLLFTLKLVEETAASMQRQGISADFVLTFRGETLPLLKAAPDAVNDAERAMFTEVRERLAVFHEKGMALEACNVAAGLFKITQDDLDPALHLVGNSLISLIGYQNKGYALVPMY
jgi:intracellular sulfur oxidation DsrE/DsrF family protein